MKKILIFASIAALQFSSVYIPGSFAQNTGENPLPLIHYEAENIENTEQAYKILGEKSAAIFEVLKGDGELDFGSFEEIHKISYTLEAAIDKIRDENAADLDKVNAIDEAVQGIHYSSENQKDEDVRKWFKSLLSALSDIDDKNQANINKSSKPVKKEFYEIIIKNHKFLPVETIVPAGVKIKLKIINQDPTPEEFESHDMNREKIIRGNKTATIFVGPLKPGRYHFFGEFNMDTANGYIIAK